METSILIVSVFLALIGIYQLVKGINRLKKGSYSVTRWQFKPPYWAEQRVYEISGGTATFWSSVRIIFAILFILAAIFVLMSGNM